MAKRNIRAKAKSAVGVAKQKTQEVQAKLRKESRQDEMLHKTLTGKKTPTKKQKSDEKHKKLLKRFVETKQEVKEENARLNRMKTKVVGDMKALRDALPSLSSICEIVKKKKESEAKEKLAGELAEPEKLSTKQKMKNKRKEYVNKVQSFEKLIKDKKFRQNPREMIVNHLRNKYETMEDDADE